MNSQKLEIVDSVIHHGALVDNSAVKVNWHITPLIIGLICQILWLTWFTTNKYHPLPPSGGKGGVYMYVCIYPVLLLGWNFTKAGNMVQP